MQSVQQARAHVVCITCFANMALGVLLPRLAHEVAFHDKLRKSHDALKRQAAGRALPHSIPATDQNLRRLADLPIYNMIMTKLGAVGAWRDEREPFGDACSVPVT